MSLPRFFKNQFKKHKEIPEYFYAFRVEWVNVAWGVGPPAVAFIILWSLNVIQDVHKIGYFFLWAFFMAGYYVWRADHVRLEKKIFIARVSLREFREYSSPPARWYNFEVVNESEGTTIEDVSVQLSSMSPAVHNFNPLPVPLHLTHDNPAKMEDQMRSFNLNPHERRNVDFVTAKDGDNHFNIVHVVPNISSDVRFDTRAHRLQVMITAKNMPIVVTWFRVWRDETGLLMCKKEDLPISKFQEILC